MFVHGFLRWVTVLHGLRCLDGTRSPTHPDAHLDKLFARKCDQTEFKETGTNTERMTASGTRSNVGP